LMNDKARLVLKVVGGIFAVAAVLVVTLVVALMLLDWNRLRPFIADQSEERLGRRIEIQGPLEVRFGLAPRIVANDVRVANAPWGRDPHMFEAEHALLHFRIVPLIFGRIEVLDAEISNARLAVEQNKAGEGNWDFIPLPEPTEDPAWPRVERFAIRDVGFTYDDHRKEGSIAGRVERLTLSAEDETALLLLSGKGSIEQLPVSLKGHLGSIHMMDEGDNVPVEIDLTVGNQNLRLAGHTGPELTTSGSRFDVTAEGENLHSDLEALNFQLGAVPPYEISLVFEIQEGRYNVEDLRATLGFSQITGQLALQPDPPTVVGELRIARLHLEDFASFLDPEREFLDEPLPLGALRSINSSLTLTLVNLTSNTFVDDLLFQARAVLELREGVLKVAPLSVTLAYGRVNGRIVLDATRDSAGIESEIEIEGIRLEEIVAEIDPPEHIDGWIATEAAELTEQIAGTLGGTAEARARGETPRQMLETLNGSFAVAMERGSMSYVIDRLVALDLAGLTKWLIGDEAIDIECMVTLMEIENGVAEPEIMLLASEDTNIWGEGQIDLRDGIVDLTLEALPRDPGIGVLRSPLIIEGDLTSPDIRPEAGPLVGRGVIGAALGVLATPIAALLGTITTGPGEEAVCLKYVSELQAILEGEIPD
jgi:AsmA family protein